ncbi:MAG: PHP domain-containing protein [Gammaproteobacteria bacterium]|nr:MAG: PHP domain-containing protein [Gammaproteobacteria bacterium]
MSARIDLHLHTTASDGTLSPAELLALVAENGIALMAVTDHDTLAGYRELAAMGTGQVQLLCGIEWSARWSGGEVHVVGLGMDPQAPALQATIDRQQALRPERASRMAERLAKCGIADALAGASAIAAGGSIGRVHFARYLVQCGVVHSEDEAFRRYLGDGARAHVRCEWPMLDEVIAWTQAAGGVAVLAHPMKYRLTRTKLAGLMAEFAEAGGDAVEWPLFPAGQQKDTQRWLAKQLRSHGLGLSVGSDFHGQDSRWNRPGKVAQVLPEGIEPVWSRWLPVDGVASP